MGPWRYAWAAGKLPPKWLPQRRKWLSILSERSRKEFEALELKEQVGGGGG